MTIEAPKSGSGTENAPDTAKRPIDCSVKFGDNDLGGDSTDGDRTSLLLLGLVIIGLMTQGLEDLGHRRSKARQRSLLGENA